MRWTTTQFWLVMGAVTVGYVLGQSHSSERAAHAEVRETPPRAAFLAGSERSETILREIETTLKTMDGRLERIEKLAADKKETAVIKP